LLFTELETDRLMLKNISSEDRHFVLQQFSNNEVNRYLFDAEPTTDLLSADEIVAFYNQPEPRNQHRWIIIRKKDGVKIGTCGFHCWDKSNGRCDIGYDLHPDFWGNGYMSEAMKVILNFAENKMDIKQINACIYTENHKSIRLIEKHGFVHHGQMKDEVFRGEKYAHKVFIFELSKIEDIKSIK